MKNILKKVIKKSLNLVGLDIIRSYMSPAYTFLGLRNLPIKTIIDIGANEGQFARQILEIFPQANLFCFEPLPTAFANLEKWASKQGSRVKTFNLALGDSKGKVEMLAHVDDPPSSSILKTTNQSQRLYSFTTNQVPISVNLTTLDKVLNDFSHLLVPDILIKIDVQGYEDRVIKGGKITFSKAQACIIEVILENLYEGQARFEHVTTLLSELGYSYAGNLGQCYDAENGSVIFIDAMFTRTKCQEI